MITQELKNTLTFILAGGQGERLKPLTLERAKPAVPFGGAYRIIDFTLSNCIHSGLRQIYVLTQYRARSLEEHIRFGWNFLPRRLEQFIGVRPPHHHLTAEWYRGTADAIYQNIDSIDPDHRNVLILSGDHVYRMDYGAMLRDHLSNNAMLTIGAAKIPVADSPRFGVFEVDKKNRVASFEEKPRRGKEIPGDAGWCFGSMGIYLFDAKELIRRLSQDAEMGSQSTRDFGRDVIPRMIPEGKVFAHHFTDPMGSPEPYWRDVGTIDSYYDANLDLCAVSPKFNLYDRRWPTYTLWHNDPPAKTVFDESDGRRAQVVDSLVCPGVVVSGATVRRSLLSNLVFVDERSTVEESIVFRGARIGKKVKVRRAIIDKWAEIPDGAEIGYDLDADRKRFTVSDSGIVIVPRRYRY